MTTITIEDAQAKLPELINGLSKGEELVITRGEQVVARIVGERPGRNQWPSKAGSGKTGVYWMAPGFNAPLEEFREYMG